MLASVGHRLFKIDTLSTSSPRVILPHGRVAIHDVTTEVGDDSLCQDMEKSIMFYNSVGGSLVMRGGSKFVNVAFSGLKSQDAPSMERHFVFSIHFLPEF